MSECNLRSFSWSCHVACRNNKSGRLLVLKRICQKRQTELKCVKRYYNRRSVFLRKSHHLFWPYHLWPAWDRENKTMEFSRVIKGSRCQQLYYTLNYWITFYLYKTIFGIHGRLHALLIMMWTYKKNLLIKTVIVL